MSAAKRLMQELQKASDFDVNPENILSWKKRIVGPTDSPFEGGTWILDIKIPQEYPMKPPIVTFETRICHPNIHFQTGQVCLDLLKDRWTPAYTIQMVIDAILLLLTHPEPDSPLNCDIANLLRANDIIAYNSLVSYYTKLYAK